MPAELGTKLVTARFGNEAARTLAGYEATGGYQAVKKALAMTPDAITSEELLTLRIESIHGPIRNGQRPGSYRESVT